MFENINQYFSDNKYRISNGIIIKQTKNIKNSQTAKRQDSQKTKQYKGNIKSFISDFLNIIFSKEMNTNNTESEHDFQKTEYYDYPFIKEEQTHENTIICEDMLLDEDIHLKYILMEEFKNLLKSEPDLSNLITLPNQQQYIKEFQINQIQDSYLIKKLTYQFQLNRFHHLIPNINLFVKDFILFYYEKYVTQLQFKQPYDEQYKPSIVQFENNAIAYTQYYSVKQQMFFNTYQFINEQKFIKASKMNENFENLLIKDVFCEIIYTDYNKMLIFEESFELSFKQILENGQFGLNFDSSDFTKLLLQLIDVALLLDEYGIYYNLYDIENIGIIFKEGKSIIKLRKKFLLKQDFSDYEIKTVSIKRCMNKFNRRLVLYYEILSIFDVISQFEYRFEFKSTKFQKQKSLFVDSPEYQSYGIDQYQIVETLEKSFGNDVLNHYPQLNNQHYQLMIKGYNQLYIKNLREKSNENEIVKLYSKVLKELTDNSQYQKMCCINQLMIMLINLQNNQLELVLEQIHNQANSVGITFQIQIHSLLQLLLDSISSLYLKDEEFKSLLVILDKIDAERNLTDDKKYVILLQVLIQTFKKYNLNNHQNLQFQSNNDRVNTSLSDIQSENSTNDNFNQSINSNQSSTQFQKSILIRELSFPNQEQKQKEDAIITNIQQLLYIDMNLILHAFGFTVEKYSQPYNAENKFILNLSQVDAFLFRKYEILYKENIYQEDIKDFVSRIQLIRKETIQKEFVQNLPNLLIKIVQSDIEKTNNLSSSTPISQMNNNQLHNINYHLKFQYIKTLENIYNEKEIQLDLLNMGNDQYYAYNSYDKKKQKSYFLINVMNTEFFYQQLEHLLSINQNIHLNKYLAKIAYIDFDYQIIYAINGTCSFYSLLDVYKRANTTIQEKELIIILYQILKIFFFLIENKYYIINFDLNSFSLFKVEIPKINIKYYVKYINVVSITNNLTKAMTEIKYMNNSLFYQQNQEDEFSFSEEMYLKISIQQICFNMVNLILYEPDQTLNIKQKNCQRRFQKNLNIIKQQYKYEKISKIFDFLFNDLIKLQDKQQMFQNICEKFGIETKQQVDKKSQDNNQPEKQFISQVDNKCEQNFNSEKQNQYDIDNKHEQYQLVYIPRMVSNFTMLQKNKLKQCISFIYYQKIPPFLSFLPHNKLTELLENIHNHPIKHKRENIILEDYIKIMINYYHVFLSYFDLISNQIILNNMPLQEHQQYQFVQLKMFLPKLLDETKFNNDPFYHYKKQKHIQFIKYFLKQGIIDKSLIKRSCLISKDKLKWDKTLNYLISTYSKLLHGDYHKLDQSLDAINLQEEKLENQDKKKNGLFLNYCYKYSIESVLIKLQYPSLLQFRESKLKHKLKNYSQTINKQYYKDRQITLGFDNTLIYIYYILIELRKNNYEKVLRINNKFIKLYSSEDKITSIGLTIITKQIKCICMIMLGQDVQKELKQLEDIFVSRIIFQQNKFMNSPQREFLELSKMASELFLRNYINNTNLIEYYCKQNINQYHNGKETASFNEYLFNFEKSNKFVCLLKFLK